MGRWSGWYVYDKKSFHQGDKEEKEEKEEVML